MQSGAVGLRFCNVRTMWCIFKHCNLVDGQAMQTGSFLKQCILFMCETLCANIGWACIQASKK
jgi:hypothetical protein